MQTCLCRPAHDIDLVKAECQAHCQVSPEAVIDTLEGRYWRE